MTPGTVCSFVGGVQKTTFLSVWKWLSRTWIPDSFILCVKMMILQNAYLCLRTVGIDVKWLILSRQPTSLKTRNSIYSFCIWRLGVRAGGLYSRLLSALMCASCCVTRYFHTCVLQVLSRHCSMTSEELFHLPLNIYIIILGIGLFILMLSLLFCCYMSRYDLTCDLCTGVPWPWWMETTLSPGDTTTSAHFIQLVEQEEGDCKPIADNLT